MDTGRVTSAPTPEPLGEPGTSKKVYPRLCLDGASAAYGQLIDQVDVDDEVKFMMTGRVVLVSSASGNDWDNRIEIEVSDITPVGMKDKDFGDE